MTITLDREQAEVLREILQAELKELKVETRHAFHRKFREGLYSREDQIERVLAQLPNQRSNNTKTARVG
jgi:hypothetical protein